MALTARYDEVTMPVEFSVGLPKSVAKAKVGVSLVGHTLSLNVPRSVVGKSVKIVDVRGNVMMRKTVQSVNETMNVETLNRGLYIVQVETLSANKFIVK
jgi:hypothetical protein